MQKDWTKGFSAKWLAISIGVLFIILLSVAVIFVHRYPSLAHVSSDYHQSAEKITDMAPHIPNSDKTAIVVRHSDSSSEKFLVPNATVDSFIKSLPKGDKLISQTSPAQ